MYYVNMQHNYVHMRIIHDKMQDNYIDTHIDINKSHLDTNKVHVDIIYFGCTGQKYA